MQDLDFEQVRGFEPPVIKPFLWLGSTSDLPCDDPSLKAAAHLRQLDELMLSLEQANRAELAKDQQPAAKKSRPRQYTRLRVSRIDSTAQLHILGRNYDCRLVEMSIGGFGVFLPRLLSIHPGTLGQLCAPGMNYVVSVTRIEAKDGGVFIGLKQIEEVIADKPFQLYQRTPLASYAIAGIAGILTAVIAYYFMYGHIANQPTHQPQSTQCVL